MEVVFDDPILGLCQGVTVHFKFSGGQEADLTTDEAGIVKLEARPGDFADTEYQREGIVHRQRVFLSPPDIVATDGTWQRLVNLGYVQKTLPPRLPESEPQLALAIEEFQAEFGLDPTGNLDNATRERIRRAHDEDQQEWQDRHWASTPVVGPNDPSPKSDIS